MFLSNERERIRFYRKYNDFENAVPSDLTLAVTGAGAQNTEIAPQTAEMTGVMASETGSTTTGAAGWRSGASAIRLDSGGRWQGEWKVRTGANLSDATDTYTLRVGFLDSIAAEPVDGLFFRYVHSANGGKWACVSRANSVETVIDSGILVAVNTNYILTVELSPLADQVYFYIDGARVASTKLTIPVGASRETGYGAFILKSVGTASRFLYTDSSDVVCVYL